MDFWIRHPRSHKPDTMLTVSIYASILVAAKFILSGMEVHFGSFSFSFGSVDASLIGAILGPTLFAYVARKFKDSPDAQKGASDDNDQAISN